MFPYSRTLNAAEYYIIVIIFTDEVLPRVLPHRVSILEYWRYWSIDTRTVKASQLSG